jgi:methyl-accepting chemotaxis protein
MFSRMHLKYKIFFSFLVVSCFALIVGSVGYVYLQKVVGKYDHVVTVNLGNLQKMDAMRDSVRILRARMSFIVGFPKGHEAEVKESIERMEREIGDYEKSDKAYSEIPFVAGEEELYNKVTANWKAVKEKTIELLTVYKKEGGNDQVVHLFFDGYAQATDEYFKSIESLMSFQDKESIKWSKESTEAAALSTRVSVGIMVFSFIISIFIGSILVKTLTGQLTSVINELNITTPQLTESSTSMSSLSTQLSSSATEQAAAVQETASSLEEISAMIRRNSDNANNAKSSSTTSLQSVKSGQIAVANMLTAMEEINQNNDSFNSFMTKNNEELSEMVKVITNISDKTKVINDIVFQTKLLSFNASVEAARAGEQGKGFAVVAEEVGNLAQMSGNAANEISGLLAESIIKVNNIVNSTKSQVQLLVNDGKDKIKSGIEKANECNSALTEINNTVASVEALVSEVAHASGEQSQGIDEVNKAMGQIDEVTNQNSVASQSVSTNAAQVLQLSSSIKLTSDKLTLLLTGGKEFKSEVKLVQKAKEVSKEVSKIKEFKEVKTAKILPMKIAEKIKPANTKAEKPKLVAKTGPVPVPQKRVNESQLPSHNDSRFEDV